VYSLNFIFIFYHNIYIITCFNCCYRYGIHVFKIYSTFIIWSAAIGRLLNSRLLIPSLVKCTYCKRCIFCTDYNFLNHFLRNYEKSIFQILWTQKKCTKLLLYVSIHQLDFGFKSCGMIIIQLLSINYLTGNNIIIHYIVVYDK